MTPNHQNLNVKTVSTPGVERTRIVPLCMRMIPLQTLSPIPDPAASPQRASLSHVEVTIPSSH